MKCMPRLLTVVELDQQFIRERVREAAVKLPKLKKSLVVGLWISLLVQGVVSLVVLVHRRCEQRQEYVDE